jgi:uncharacterized membrane protein
MIRVTTFAVTAIFLLSSSLTHAQDTPQQMQRGDKMMHMREGGEGGKLMGLRLRDVMMKLSPEGRKIMMDSMRAQPDLMKENREKQRINHDRILAIINADKFDAGALKKAFAEERNLNEAAQQNRQDALVSTLSKLSDADRKIVATSMMEMRDKMQERAGKWRDHKGRSNMPKPTPGN